MKISHPLIIALLIINGVFASKMSVAVFPLAKGPEAVVETWVGYGFAETVSRVLKNMDGFRVWDPVFLYQTDTTLRDGFSDSLLAVHRNRWAWDAAIGGSYTVIHDSILLNLTVYWASGREEPLKIDLAAAGPVSNYYRFCNEVIAKIFTIIQQPLTTENAETLGRIPPCDLTAYKTFAAGYGYEMLEDRNGAITAYARAEEIDSRCSLAALRAALLYRGSSEFGLARSAFERAYQKNQDDPVTVAAYAGFLVDQKVAGAAARFVSGNREKLEKSSEGLTAMGQLFVSAGEYQRAIALLTKAVAFGSGDLHGEFALGTAYLASGDFPRAIDMFNHLIQFRPGYLRFYASLGGTYRKAGKLMESTLILEAAEKLAPDNTTILIDLAHTYIVLGWYEKAGQILLRARDLSPLQSEINVNLGVVYSYEGKRDLAMACFNAAAQVPTTRQTALNNMGNLLFMGGSHKKAIEAYTRANAVGNKNETVLYNLAMAYYGKKDLKKAVRYFGQMLALSPDRIDILLISSSICVSLKKYGEAERYFLKIIELMPDHENAVRGLAAILIREKRYKEALQPIENFLERQPLHKEFMAMAAGLYLTLGWHEVALMRFRALIREFPEDAAGYKGAGECLYTLINSKGSPEFDNAISMLKRASDLAPRDPVPDYYIGNIYADNKGYRDLAVEHWRKSLARSPDKRTRKMIEKRMAENR